MGTTDHETAAEAIAVSEDEAGLPLNAETATPGPVESLAAVAKALDPVTASQGTTTVFVKPATFEVLQSAGDDEPDWSADEEEPVIVQAIPAGEDQTEAGHRDEASPRRVSRPELASSSSARAASVSRAGEAGELTSRTATRTRSESPKVRFGTAHLQLIREIAQADSANFKSLKKVVEGSNVSALTKSQTLDRLEQLAYQRGVASLEGKIRAIDVQRDVAQRARTEAAYLESLTPEMRALEQNNPVRPSAGASKTSDVRMQQAIAAGGSVWVERRKQKGRERAARHREAQAAQAAEERAAATSVIADLPVDQRGPALDAEMDRRAREELTEFRRMKRERQKDSKRRAALKWQRWRQRRSTDDMDCDTNHAIAHLGSADRGEESPAPAARFAFGEDPVDCAMHRGDGDTRSCPSAAGRGDGHLGRCADAAGDSPGGEKGGCTALGPGA
ncbi:Trpt1 [Symbiodinium sp. CCMP2592]|nr:Trpt1 [Symbiodinium sp. CCMP2592]